MLSKEQKNAQYATGKGKRKIKINHKVSELQMKRAPYLKDHQNEAWKRIENR